ncbi:hypothetical protein ACIQ1H_09170 [Lysinibacillus sp. NPDC097279]|uniref:hypothetical protein n=1 Tax=Lysinibacillus sp. NPDC097279 TaxID=3364143 RepID=UPI00381260B6
MTEIYKFFNSAPGDERWHYASDFADYFGKVLSTGLLHKDGRPNLQVKVKAGTLQTYVEPGEALMQGYQYQNTQDLYLTHNIPESNLDRIDRIVLRLDKRNSSRYIKLFVKEGVSAVNPVAPVLQRDNYIHEISLAQIRLIKNTATLNPLFLVDERMQESLCGIVYSLISVPTSVFQQQWDSWFNIGKYSFAEELNKWMDEEKASFTLWQEGQKSDFVVWRDGEEALYQSWIQGRKANFDEWFATIRGILDEEAAGNIMNVINDHKDSPVPHKYYDEGLAQPMLYGMKRNAILDTPAFVYGATEAGPHEVINLPNYEQVEDVKTVLTSAMEATGGKVADVDGKMYKAVMFDNLSIKHAFGSDYWDPIIQSYKTKYPSFDAAWPALSMITSQRIRLWDNIYMVVNVSTNMVVFLNMETLQAIGAVQIVAYGIFDGFVKPENGWFTDDKYLYLRGQYASSNSRLIVIDKTTLSFVKVIQPGNSPMFSGSDTFVGEMARVGSNFFVITNNVNVITAYRLVYDGSGVPAHWLYDTQQTFRAGAIRGIALWGIDSDLYVMSQNDGGSYYMEKWYYNPTSKEFVKNYDKYNSAPGIGQACRWSYKYEVNGIKYVLLSCGTTSMHVINLTTGTQHQTIMSAPFNNEFPTFDYENGNKFLIMSTTLTGYEISGDVYLPVSEMHLTGVTWVSYPFYMAGLRSTGNALSPLISLGTYGYYKDGQLYARYAPRYAAKIEPVNVILSYKEVIE